MKTQLNVSFRLFVDYPEWAALTGLYPKTDSSHGFPNPYNYEMYRDFQENNINSDVIFWYEVSLSFTRVGSVCGSCTWPLYTGSIYSTITWYRTIGCKGGFLCECPKRIFKKAECGQWRNGQTENERLHWFNRHGRTLRQSVKKFAFN